MPLPAADPPGIGCCRDYKLVFQDDFDAFDTQTWVPTPAHGSTFPAGAISVADSILTIRADQNSPVRKYIWVASIGPAVGTYPKRPKAKAWEEGYFEVRAATAAIPSSGSAWIRHTIWFFSLEEANHWPDSPCPTLVSEWDMIENGIGGTLTANDRHTSVIHRNTNGGCSTADSSVSRTADGTNFNDWHTWGGLWRNGSLSTFCDGVPLTRHTAYDSTAQPMYIILSAMPLGAPLPAGHESDPEPDFIETYVDWVRVWQ